MGVEKGGYLENPDAEKAKLQAVVDACIDAGIYVVIDFHTYTGHDHVEEATTFFDEMAQKYGDKPNVLFETYNEPEKVDWATVIKPYHEQIVPVIRKHSDNVIILGTRIWSTEVDVASKDPVQGDNLAYTIHFYAASMGADLREKVSTALANGAAIFATEWGTCEYTGDGHLDLEESQAWMDFFEENHISDSNWAVSDKAESCSALHGGASTSGGWSEGDLTESGNWVRNSIREYNSDGPLASVSAASPVASTGLLTPTAAAPAPTPAQALVSGTLVTNVDAASPVASTGQLTPTAVAPAPTPHRRWYHAPWCQTLRP
jgi:aryl-phospho-beta-D-glucosidase BglC (GH1 family)